MKRLLTVFMSIMIILGLTACDGSKTEIDKPKGEKYTKEEKKTKKENRKSQKLQKRLRQMEKKNLKQKKY